MKPGGIDSLELIPGLLKNLKLRTLKPCIKYNTCTVEQTLRLMRRKEKHYCLI
jgi:hypothetical protein